MENQVNNKVEDCEVYKLIYENTVNAVFLTDPSGKIYEANAAAEDMLGMNMEEICSSGTDALIDILDPNFKLFRREREKYGKASGELKFIRKDGSRLPVEASSNIFKLKNGESRICFIAHDIVESKINQLLMKEASEFNRRIIKSAPVGIATYNSMGQCISVNDYFAEIVGASKEILLSQNFTELISWRKYGLYTLAKLVLNEGIEVNKEIFIITTFGKNLWLNLTFTSFTSGSEPHLLMMIENITDRKKAEDLLKKSEEKFRTSVENMLDPFAIFEAVRNSENKIVDFSTRYINPAGVNLAEKISADTPLRHLLEIFTLQDYSVMFKELCEIIETGKALNRESVLYDPLVSNTIKCALDLKIVKLGDGLAISCREITETKTVLEKLKE
ncbi:MAG: PAS domain-containing protein, partial [Ignavibacteriaceae bacterium]